MKNSHTTSNLFFNNPTTVTAARHETAPKNWFHYFFVAFFFVKTNRRRIQTQFLLSARIVTRAWLLYFASRLFVYANKGRASEWHDDYCGGVCQWLTTWRGEECFLVWKPNQRLNVPPSDSLSLRVCFVLVGWNRHFPFTSLNSTQRRRCFTTAAARFFSGRAEIAELEVASSDARWRQTTAKIQISLII